MGKLTSWLLPGLMVASVCVGCNDDGVDSDDEQENSRAGITFSTPLSAQHSLKFFYSRGVVTTIGNDFDTVGAVWQYRWGA